MLRVTHYQRKSVLGAYSIERLFSDIRSAMPTNISVTKRTSSFLSQGLWRRVYCIIEAAFWQGDVNHVTGDVHFLTLLLRRRRTVLTILDCVSLERLSGLEKWVLWLLWYRLPISRVSAVTVISNATKRELLKYIDIDPTKISVIYCCVSDTFQRDERIFNASCPRILQVGSGANKNIERVAASLVGITCKWVVIGRLTKTQIASIEGCGITYENHIGLSDVELLEQYRNADMLVFASTYEGYGLPIVEANAVGRSVITSKLYSMPEVAGDAACLVDPYDVSSIRDAILRIIKDAVYRDGLIEAGFKNAERFRSKNIAQQYAQLYQRLHSDNIL